MQTIDNKETKIIIWFNRIFRWSLGSLFSIVGFLYDSKIAIGFGIAMIITGFFRPKRCLQEGCNIKNKQ